MILLHNNWSILKVSVFRGEDCKCTKNRGIGGVLVCLWKILFTCLTENPISFSGYFGIKLDYIIMKVLKKKFKIHGVSDTCVLVY